MTMSINTNVSSLTAQRNLSGSANGLSTAMQRLSSGFRINSAKDDAAGLAISDRMTSQIRGMNQAVRNANDGISLSQTAEGALQESTNLLQRMRELAVQSANDTNTETDRAAIQTEVTQLVAEYDRIATQTEFNGKTVLNGTFAGSSFQIGANANQTITVAISDSRSSVMGTKSVAATVFAPTNAAMGQITITGSTGSATITGVSLTTKGKVDEINAVSSTTGITASQSGNFKVSDTALGTSGAITAGDITINGIQIGAISAAAVATQAASTVTAINAKTGEHGVTATLGTGANGAIANAIILSNTTGAAITVGLSGTATAATTGLEAGTMAAGENGAITLSTSLSGSISLAGGGTPAAAGFAAGAQTLTTNTLTNVSVLDKAKSNTAIKVLDAALKQVDSQRATLGAVQNRFESTIANLQNVAENLTSARSQIKDADFAAETSAMTKGNILQQAGIAMLSQANSQSQNILSLLR